MAIYNQQPDWCSACVRGVRGFSSLTCPKCGASRRTIGYAGVAEKRHERFVRARRLATAELATTG